MDISEDEKRTVEVFLERCETAHQAWQFQKALFVGDNKLTPYDAGPCRLFFDRLDAILIEYSMLQVRKLHDKNRDCLTINHIIKLNIWPDQTKKELEKLRDNIESLKFLDPLKDARDNIIAHSNRKTALKWKKVGELPPGDDDIYFENPGEFPHGQDGRYFEYLEKFASLASQDIMGKPFLYSNTVNNEVAVFKECFLKGMVSAGFTRARTRKAD